MVGMNEAVKRLRDGDVVALPTETVYGLAARIDHEAGLRQIFAVKARPFFDPLIVHVSGLDQAQSLAAQWPELYTLLAKEFWPGPLTLIVPKADVVSTLITAGLTTVGLRCPAHPLAQQAIARVGVPLAAPSANRFGRTSPTRAEHVLQEFSNTVAVVDGGPCDVGLESTVIEGRWTGSQWQIDILRPGGVSQNRLRQFLQSKAVPHTMERLSSAKAPGHLKAHYQPESPVILLHSPLTDTELKQKFALGHGPLHRLRLADRPEQAARELYQQLRDLSAPGATIVVERPAQHNTPEWEAIWDRLERAASWPAKG